MLVAGVGTLPITLGIVGFVVLLVDVQNITFDWSTPYLPVTDLSLNSLYFISNQKEQKRGVRLN